LDYGRGGNLPYRSGTFRLTERRGRARPGRAAAAQRFRDAPGASARPRRVEADRTHPTHRTPTGRRPTRWHATPRHARDGPPRRTLCAESVQTRHPNDDSSRGAARGADGRRFANGAARGDRPGVPDAGGVGGRRLKTDDTEGRLDALVEAYAPQVTAYARQWG